MCFKAESRAWSKVHKGCSHKGSGLVLGKYARSECCSLLKLESISYNSEQVDCMASIAQVLVIGCQTYAMSMHPVLARQSIVVLFKGIVIKQKLSSGKAVLDQLL